ncbi:WD40 repeat-like protein [Haematococcus lacustris]
MDDGYAGSRGYRGYPDNNRGRGRGRRSDYYNDYNNQGTPAPYHQGPPPPPPRQNDGWQGRGRGYYDEFDNNGFRGGRGYRGRGRQSWGRSSGGNRDPPREREKQARDEDIMPDDVAALTQLTGHTQKISAITFDSNTAQLYSSSSDGTVRAWSAVSGQCVSTVEVGGEVDCLLVGGGYLFAGYRKGTEGIIKVWNMATSASHLLTGHKGSINAMVIASVALVSGGTDSSIRVWNFNQQAGIFMSQAIITKEDGGHDCSVLALSVSGTHMFSADRRGGILVWDLASGKSVQRLPNAHAESVMSMLMFESYLLSAGMDGMLKAWQVMEVPQPGLVIRPDPEYVFDKENPDGADSGSQQQQRRRPRAPPGIITMAGTSDAGGNPVLMVAYNAEPCVRLYKLPDFSCRGVLTPAGDVRCLGTVPGTVMLIGDTQGHVRVFQWKA